MDVHFHIQTPRGTSLTTTFPAELSARQLVSELVTDPDRGIQPSDPAAWDLLDENTDQLLDPNKSLAQNGVTAGSRLQLVPRKQHDDHKSSEEPLPSGSRALTRCDNGHYYDARKHTQCPFCGVSAIDFGPKKVIVVSEESILPEGKTVPYRAKQVPASPGVGDDAATRGLPLVHDLSRIDPVVGWLVNVGGPEKGRDYRIRSENNTIGRSKDMYICISGDESISRERHTVITFDPTRNTFHLSPGEGRGLVYLNGEALLAHKQLSPYDVILLGKTKLVFVPFCGEKFKWE